MKWLKWALVIVAAGELVALGAVICYWAQIEKARVELERPQTVRARRFEVVDAHGRLRAAFGMTLGYVELLFTDRHGRLRAELRIPPGGSPALTLRDNGGNPRIVALLSPTDGTPSLVLVGEDGKTPCAVVGYTPPHMAPSKRQPDSSLALFNKAGKLVWSAP